MGLKFLFGKNTKKTNKEMYLDERLEKGLITYEEAADNFAEQILKGCVLYQAKRKELFIERKRAQAESFADDIYMRRADALDAAISEYFKMKIGYINNNIVMKKKINILTATNIIGAAEMEHRLEYLMERYGSGFNKDDIAERCLKASIAKKVMEGDDASYMGMYRDTKIDTPTKSSILAFINICEVINNNTDSKKPVYNENGFFYDANGNLLEEDLITNWPRPDMELFGRLKLKDGRQLYERYADATQQEKEKYLSYCIDDAIKDALVYSECTKEIDEASDNSIYAALVREQMISDVSILNDGIKRNLGEEARDAFEGRCIEMAGEEYKESVRAIFSNASIWNKYLPDTQRMFDDKGRIIG
ncbi:MAG: hypothetical protein J6I68_00460 [Butyrivibrio sp.]|uniref:hypothetical protein n=1 Tax=Butyrivibrio sp. TaxID=28121 RepID=UPI001B7A4193|nr:hypothetical protein [Butyrivibrio sp.]MBP3781699.1 hypothetical protein [Butyrivibrio sp.]